MAFLQGWLAYAEHASTYKYRRHIIRLFNQQFPLTPKSTIQQVKQEQQLTKRTIEITEQYTTQKTLFLLKKGYSPIQIALKREITHSTVWEHIAKLIEHNQLSLHKMLPKEKINTILPHIHHENDKRLYIKERINNTTITFNEINCVLADVKRRNKKKNITTLTQWYQRNYCYRKCYTKHEQQKTCKKKFEQFTTNNPSMSMKQEEFLHLFNNHMIICVLSEQEKRKYVTWKEFKSNHTK